MSASTVLVLFIVGIAVSIALGNKLKVNIGLIAMLYSFIMGVFFMGLKASDLTAMWPTKVFFTIMSITLFFGFATENGALGQFALHLVYRFRKQPAILPMMFFAAAAIICFTGASPYAPTAVLVPVMIPLCAAIGMNPIAGVLIENLGAVSTSWVPWGQGANIAMGVLTEQYDTYEAAHHVIATGFFTTLIYALVAGVIVYVFFRCYKAKAAEQFLKEPEPYTSKQKTSLLLIVLLLACMMVPSALGSLGMKAMGGLSRKLDISYVCLTFAAISSALKLADEKKVITRHVPWGTIIMLGGIAMLVNLAQKGGAVDLIGTWVGSNVPAALAAPVMCAVAAFMSIFVSGASVVTPTLFQLVPSITAASGAAALPIYHFIYVGSLGTSISPFSGGGSLTLACCPGEELRNKLFTQLILAAVFQCVVACALSFCPFL